MKAIVITKPGDASVLKIKERQKPTPGPGEVLIKVAAAGLNRADIAQRKGHYPAPKGVVADIPGLEVSGTIEDTGKEVTSLKPGDEVCALLAGGGYAEYVTVHASHCLPIPKGISLTHAAAIPEALCTVWLNLFQTARFTKNQTTLIYGGSGGIGSMAIQLVTLYGGKAYSMASTSEKIAYCTSLGAHKTANYKTDNLVEFFGENSVHVILEMIGGDYLNQNLDILKEEGKMVYINAKTRNSSLNIFKLMQKRITLTGSTLRARSTPFKTRLINTVLKEAYPLIQNPKFINPVSREFSFQDVQKAHEIMEAGDFMGKMVLSVNFS